MRRNNLKANLAQMKANRDQMKPDKEFAALVEAAVDRQAVWRTQYEAAERESLDETANPTMIRAERAYQEVKRMRGEQADAQAKLNEEYNYKPCDTVRYIPAPERTFWDKLIGWMK